MDESIREEVRRFRSYLGVKGYSKHVVKNYGFRLSTFLKACPDALGGGEDRTRMVVEEYIAGLPPNTARTIPAGALRTWSSFVFDRPYKRQLVIADFVADDAIMEELASYEGYLRGLGRLKESTIRGNLQTVTKFLYTAFPAGGFHREAVTCEVVLDFLTTTLAHTTAATRAGSVARVKSYVRYLGECGVDTGSLDQISFSFPNRREHAGVGWLSEESYRNLVGACDTATDRGRRDLAMIYCLGNLGLRACDVAGLTVDDIDWREAVITVKDSKSKTERRLPLDQCTGAAIEQYVSSRGVSATRALFLGADGGAVTSASIATAVRLAAGRASIPEYHGTHGLRRMVATNMINAGIDVKVIADVLGHERIATTMMYARVDMASLRTVAAPWPRGAVS